MYILHIIPKEKFTIPYINFINENFDKSDHVFLIDNGNFQTTAYIDENIIDSNHISKREKRMMICECKKIILHNLPKTDIMLFMISRNWVLKKTFWAIWGADLYYFMYRTRGIKSYFKELFRKIFIRNIGGIITHVRGDYDLAKKWYGAKGQYHYSFLYPSNLYHPVTLNKSSNKQQLVVLLGNSADPRNEHIEVLNKLKKYQIKDIEVICPLSYGTDEEYIDSVIREGSRIFGNRFIPITQFMQFGEYLQVLSNVDVAIFNHRRQQALGNITTLIGIGKKVYIRNDITTWEFCVEHKLKVYDACGSLEDIFEKMNEKDRSLNIENIKEQFSEKKLKSDWNEIFIAPLLDN